MLKPWANMRVLPGLSSGAMHSSYRAAWPVSGVRIMMVSAQAAAARGSSTSKPSAVALARLREASGRPIRTSTPESRRFCAWAWPWEP